MEESVDSSKGGYPSKCDSRVTFEPLKALSGFIFRFLSSYDRCLRQMRAKIQEEHEATQLLTKESFADYENWEHMLIATRRDDYLEQIFFLIEDGVILRLQQYNTAIRTGMVTPETLGRQKSLVESYIEHVLINIRKGKPAAANLPNTITNSRAEDSSLIVEYVA